MEADRPVLSYDEVGHYLDEVAESIPQELFEGLNGGVVLLRSIRLSTHAKEGDLYTLGQYNHDPYGLGRYIQIFYGSFVQVYANKSVEQQKEGLRTLLLHELTHHVESLAGVRDLEVKDEISLQKYQDRWAKKMKNNNRTNEKLATARGFSKKKKEP